MIKFLDLQNINAQHAQALKQAASRVIDSGWYVLGQEVKAFEQDFASYCGTQHCVGMANGLDALVLTLRAWKELGKLKEGDEVIVPANTYIASVLAITENRLKPVLVEPDMYTYNMIAANAEKAITPKTKAIVPVHLFGRAANMEAIMAIAKEHNLYVIEDNAQAIGANCKFSDGTKKKAGTIGHVASTSFFPSKNLGCYGDGGAIFTNDDDLAHKIRGIVNHGMYVRYHHDVVGVNSRLDSIQAGVLKAKLPFLDEYGKARQNAARKYSAAFEGHKNIIAPSICDICDCHVFHQYTLRIIDGDRNGLMEHLLAKGIPCAIYYPIPLHSQKAYADARYKEEDFPVTNQLVKEVISLPMHTELDDEQIKFITDSVLEYFN